jgi:hypothetical protein
MLIVDPAGTWEKIEAAPRTVARVFFLFFLPLMLLSSLGEGWALMHFGLERSSFVDLPARKMKVSLDLVLRYELAQLVFGLVMVFGGALLFRKFGESFHRRHLYSETFVTIAYSLSPLFLLRILDGLPVMNTWVCWGIGVALAVAALYRGLPRIMKPDPSNALGLYLLCSLLLIAISGVAHFLASQVLQEKILTQSWPF